ncbi:cholinesterase 1-like isoform X3 [Diabrotica virgifera virgifera]|uniref:Carboxylic ester hydrolase n=1 Tax=Diabrotica virgifera virgifera TaxID=50390 RepID=A0ABM5KT61_DIAVI|nr:cholinesterase 1-like isoform X3 [Diabrotica virgifera virgifera]
MKFLRYVTSKILLVALATNFVTGDYANLEDANDHLVVQLASHEGKVRGHTLQSTKGNTYYAFQDIPYAAPPVGKLRFKVPQAHPGWTGTINATSNTRVCHQPIPTDLPQSEDCLLINVYTPVKPDPDAKLAVYAWIHGGGYVVWDGTIHRYGPAHLIDYNIIVVTFNYRLGVLGFLTTNDGVIPGNLGLRDQNLALQWVNKNIHKFGGDPDKVTIGGESAGSGSVSSQILSKMSRGLFRGAILESGSALNTFSNVPNPGQYAFKLAQRLDSTLDDKDTTRLLEVLQNVPVKDIVDLSATLVDDKATQTVSIIPDLIWAPSVEEEYIEEPFLTKPQHQAFLDGDFNHATLLAGYTSQELLWFIPSSSVRTPWSVDTWEEFDAKSKYADGDPSRLVHPELNVAEADRATVGALLKQLYTNTTFLENRTTLIEFNSEYFFTNGVIRQADLTSQYAPAYLFEFAYTPTNQIGVEHTEELQYMWKGDTDKYVNDYQPIYRNVVCKLWSNFVKHLNPTPEKDEDLGNVIWPKVKSNNIKFMSIDKTLEVKTHPKRYKETREIFDVYLRPPFYSY